MIHALLITACVISSVLAGLLLLVSVACLGLWATETLSWRWLAVWTTLVIVLIGVATFTGVLASQ